MIKQELDQLKYVIFDGLLAVGLAMLVTHVFKRLSPSLSPAWLDTMFHIVQVSVVLFYLERYLIKIRAHAPAWFTAGKVDAGGSSALLVSVAVLLVDWDKIKLFVS